MIRKSFVGFAGAAVVAAVLGQAIAGGLDHHNLTGHTGIRVEQCCDGIGLEQRERTPTRSQFQIVHFL